MKITKTAPSIISGTHSPMSQTRTLVMGSV